MVIHDEVYKDEIRDFLKENNLDVSEEDFEVRIYRIIRWKLHMPFVIL